MAVQAEASAHIDPQLVGNSFVEQYYKVLHQYPDQLHRFYQDSSCLSRPGPNGLMISVTTTKEISEQILFLDYQNYQTEILTVDAQGSYCSGVMVLVTGYLIGKGSEKKKFAQSFFLAPQENGFYVLNDVFRFVDDKQPLVMAVINTVEESAPLSPLAPPHSEPTDVADHATLNQATVSSAEDTVTNNAAKEVDDTLTNSKGLAPEKGSDAAVLNQNSTQNIAVTDSPRAFQNSTQNVAVTDSPRKNQKSTPNVAVTESPRAYQNGNVQAAVTGTDSPRALQNGIQTGTVIDSPRALRNGIQAATETNSSRTLAQDDASKKSFASIVNALKDNSAPFQVRVPPPNSSKLSRAAAGSKGSVINNGITESPAKSLSIFVANLPMDVTVEQVKQIFLKFGPIKPNGVKVRTNQLRPNCFSFVEFESPNSVINALKASPIAFGDRKIFIEEKKGSGNVTGLPGNVAGFSGADNVRRSVFGNQIDSIKTRVNSNGRKPQGGGRNGVDNAKAQSKAHQRDGGRVEMKNTNSVQQNKAGRAAK